MKNLVTFVKLSDAFQKNRSIESHFWRYFIYKIANDHENRSIIGSYRVKFHSYAKLVDARKNWPTFCHCSNDITNRPYRTEITTQNNFIVLLQA